MIDEKPASSVDTEGRSGIYERLVQDDNDVFGQIAYSIYKRRKREFVIRKCEELGGDIVPNDVIQEFVKSQTDYTLGLYRQQAEKLSLAFVDAISGETLAEYREKLRNEYLYKCEEFMKNLQPKSWWYGVGQSFIASFFSLYTKKNELTGVILSSCGTSTTSCSRAAGGA